MKRALHRLVLRSRQRPVLAALYRGGYAAALQASARTLAALPEVASVYLHRGMSREGWEPGVSDIDLLLVRGGEEADESRCLPRLAARLAALRRVFPMLGDIWLGSAEEMRLYLRWGGLRAWEDAPDFKRICGGEVPLPPLAESGTKRRWLDPWTWLFVSHMELSRRFFGRRDELSEKREADLRKLYLDGWRFGEFILSAEESTAAPPTRGQARARVPEASRMTPLELWLDSSLRLGQASRKVLDRLAGSRRSSTRFPVEPGLSGLLEATGAAAVVCDQPYHTYLILAENASASDYGKAADAVRASAPPGVPLALEPSAWALALQSAYLGAPLGWLGAGAGRGSDTGEKLFAGWGARALGEPPQTLPRLGERLRWETAAEAASWMALWWRPLWVARGWPNRFVLYHLCTRALGLRLALEGEPSGPFCDWELLLARGAAGRNGDGRFLARLRDLMLAETKGGLDSASRGELAAGHLPVLARLMAGLKESLARDPRA